MHVIEEARCHRTAFNIQSDFAPIIIVNGKKNDAKPSGYVVAKSLSPYQYWWFNPRANASKFYC